MESNRKKRILFVQGFGTRKANIYRHVRYYFLLRQDKYEVEWFDCADDERVESVLSRCVKRIIEGQYDQLIGHSAGGALLYKTYTELADNTGRIIGTDVQLPPNPILCMPFLQANPSPVSSTIISILRLLPDDVYYNVYLPLASIANKPVNMENILNSTIQPFVKIHQLMDIGKWQSRETVDPRIIITNLTRINARTIVAKDDLSSVFDSDLMSWFGDDANENATIIDGGHEEFNATHDINTPFFHAFEKYLAHLTK